MKIETKFEIGQEVYVIIPYVSDLGGNHRVINRAEKFSIASITVRVSTRWDGKIDTYTYYSIENIGEIDERCLYATKEEAEAEIKRMWELENAEGYLQQEKLKEIKNEV
jgi:hypothetical protein